MDAVMDAAQGDGRAKLRSLPTQDRLFWKTTLAEQIQQSIADQDPDYTLRQLPPHELTVMALNEIAVK